MPARRLPWVKLWPELMEREKVRLLTDGQYRTWTYCLLAGSQQPTRWRFQTLEHVAYVTRRPVKDVQALADQHFLDIAEDGVWIHDASEYQDVAPSDILRERSANDPANPPPNIPPTGGEGSRNGRSTLREHSLEKEREIEKESREGDRDTVSAETVSNSAETSPGDDRVDEVYAHFKARVQPRARLCPRKKIAARLKRFSADELREGINHFADDPWWMENNASRGAEWFFESDSRAEQFLLMKPRPAPNVVSMNGAPRKLVDAPPDVPADSPFLKFRGAS